MWHPSNVNSLTIKGCRSMTYTIPLSNVVVSCVNMQCPGMVLLQLGAGTQNAGRLISA